MNGIILKDSIEQFGFKIGFDFWFKWSITDPIKIFYWKYISGRPLCTNCGYFLCKPDCKHSKIYGRRNIINYEKERHKQIEIESKTIREGKNGMCTYCDEEKGQVIIDDPNWDTLEKWKVCKNCEEVIEIQRELSFPFVKTERQQELNNRLLQISKETGKPILGVQFDKVDNKFEINKDGSIKPTDSKYRASVVGFDGGEE